MADNFTTDQEIRKPDPKLTNDGQLATEDEETAVVENLATQDPSGALYESAQTETMPQQKLEPKAAAAVVKETAADGFSVGDAALFGAAAIGGLALSRTPFGKQALMIGERGLASAKSMVFGTAEVANHAKAVTQNAELFTTLSRGLDGISQLKVNQFNFLKNGREAFVHGDGTIVAKSSDELFMMGRVDGVEAVNRSGASLKILKEGGNEAGSWTYAQSRIPSLEGFTMELRTGLDQSALTLKRGSHTVIGNSQGIISDTYAGAAKPLNPKVFTAAWDEIHSTSQTLRSAVSTTPFHKAL